MTTEPKTPTPELTPEEAELVLRSIGEVEQEEAAAQAARQEPEE